MVVNISKFIELFNVPEVAIPYIPIFFSEEDINLVVIFNGEELTVEETATRLGVIVEETAKVLEAAYLTSVFYKKVEDDTTYYVTASFYEVLDYKCKFDAAYFDIPKDVRDDLDQWCYDEYKATMLPFLEKAKNGEPEDREKETFLLLKDVDEFLNSREFRVVPCNCRKLKQGCNQPTDTCLRFDNSIDDRTFGKQISKEEAKEIIMNADKKGLMHTVNRDWREEGPKYMCNCCTTCCYVFRLVEDLDTKGLWPQIRYVAHYNKETCNYCGKCTTRCMFKAFYHNDSKIEYQGKMRKDIAYDAKKCFGCGLCANTCPTKSIEMHTM